MKALHITSETTVHEVSFSFFKPEDFVFVSVFEKLRCIRSVFEKLKIVRWAKESSVKRRYHNNISKQLS